MTPPPARAATMVGAGAALLCIAALAIWWPGVAAYDTAEQYRQVLSGAYDDWHPPVTARLWSVLHPLGFGTAPMFVLQVALYWTGFGLIAVALARSGKLLAGIMVLAVGVFPLFSGWQASVLKDMQMLGAMLAAVGLVARWRLAKRPIPVAAIAAVLLLLAYATLARANALFASVPLAVMLLPTGLPHRMRAAAIGVGVLAVLAVSPAINHRLLGATESDVARTLPTFDLAGIAHFSGVDDGLLPEERALIAQRHCYKPFFWDPLGDEHHCGAVSERLNALPSPALTRLWLSAIIHHPVAYAAHRLAHLNATDRFVMPTGLMGAQPPCGSEPNDLGLLAPGAAACQVSRVAGWVVETPLGWPIAWIVVAATGMCVAARGLPSPTRDLALALAVSALSLEASFALVSIASDLRYHLWPMVATSLMAVLLCTEKVVPRRPLIIGAVVLALVSLVGVTARIMLPPAPSGYAAMLG